MLDHGTCGHFAKSQTIERKATHHGLKGCGEHCLITDPSVRTVGARERNARTPKDCDASN
jgi:hypothetical protein